MSNTLYFLLFLSALHALVSVYIIVRIVRTTMLTSRQKQVNIILSILVPFFWPSLVYYMLKREPDWSDKKAFTGSSSFGYESTGGDFEGSHGGCHH